MSHLVLSDYLTVYDQHGTSDAMPVELPMEDPIIGLEIDRDGVLLNLQGILDAASSYGLRSGEGTASSEEKLVFIAEGGYHHVGVPLVLPFAPGLTFISDILLGYG